MSRAVLRRQGLCTSPFCACGTAQPGLVRLADQTCSRATASRHPRKVLRAGSGGKLTYCTWSTGQPLCKTAPGQRPGELQGSFLG